VFCIVADADAGAVSPPPFVARTLEDFDRYIAKRPDGYRSCRLCAGAYRNRTITNVRMHLEAKHFPGTFQYACGLCGSPFGTRIALQNHRQKSNCLPQLVSDDSDSDSD
jgi:hypothetical protein